MRILFFDIGEIDYKGVEIISAVLKQHGHTVDLLLDPGFGKHYYLKLPLLNHLITDARLLIKAIAFKPDIIGMSIVTNNFQYFRAFGKKLKDVMNVPIIVGGIHPTSVPEEVIKEDWVDMICIGDGEEAMVELIEKLESKVDISHIQNLWVKDKNGNVNKNSLRPLVKDLDKHPFPDRSIYAQYGVLGKRIRFMTARGCPHNCSFCVNSFRKNLYPEEHYLRKRSVQNVISELELLKKQYSPKGIRFEDDVFVLDKKWFNEFKAEYINKVSLPFHCYITPTGVSDEIVKSLKECGCESIAMGIQSGNETLRSNIMNRHYSNEKVIMAAEIIKKHGLRLYAEYMFGFPEETPENMMETLELSNKIHAYNSWSAIFYPFPGTGLYNYCCTTGNIDETIKRDIVNGKGSPQSFSVLNHPYKNEIRIFKTLLPLYTSAPRFIQKILRPLLKRKYGLLHKMIYILSIPLLEKKEFFYRVVRLPVILFKTFRILHQH